MAAATSTPTSLKEIDSKPQTPAFNIAIIGAGIGGLALAIGLSHHEPPIPFTIYESAQQFAAVGAGVGLGPNALRAMDLIDSRFRQQYMDIATGNGRPEKRHVMMEAMLMREGLGQEESWWGKGDWGGERFERTGAHRKDLLDIMTGFVGSNYVRFDKKVKEVEQVGDEVVLRFEDSEVVRHAAVVGSDGVKGFSRQVVLGKRYPEYVKPKYTGKYVYRAIIKMEVAKGILGGLATDAKMYMSKGGNISTYPITEGREVNVVMFKRDEREGGWRSSENTEEVSRKEMIADFTECEGGCDTRLLRLFDHAKPLRWGIFHHPTTPTYYTSLICLLGDVAHAGGPHQAAGAGQCLEDALILSRVLGKLYSNHPSILDAPSHQRTRIIEAAFEAYDEVRRPRAQKQVLTTQECGELYNLRRPAMDVDMDRDGDEEGEGDGDMVKVLQNLNTRFEWIWEHDLEGDVRAVEKRFEELVRRDGDDGGELARL
ncbi:FAD/NAD(P)-binding domain-containing protein [Lophiostoma macrostomum CBS 122681]|uniref:FAD/NAD(P)-binding domain-containing protein n=1 Tax=Lophiostoma macrostomum CBS 122681 TaxID=1314788 RepID=A0A6A6T7T2_9PLEO|nr:FAD/NAD(P)-binding domain-containing protein [Lophiostoma macrostomum CBS 122681]